MTEQQETETFDARYLDPKFPIVKPDPTVDDVIKTLRTRDYLFVSGITAGSWTYGYILGKPIRAGTAAMTATIGATFGALYTMQTIRSKLMGFRTNDYEVKKWGLAPVPQPNTSNNMILDRRFPKRQPLSSKPNLNWDNYN